MKFKLNKVLIPFLCVFCLLSTVSCKNTKASKESEYLEFCQKIEKSNSLVFNLLPTLQYENCIDEMFLFYDDSNLRDTYYTVYLNCTYTKEEYKEEYDRLKNKVISEAMLKINSESFNYPSRTFIEYFKFNGSDEDMMMYYYVLFDEKESRIIYVSFFDKDLNGESVNIPKKYLPKELVERRK